MCGIAGSVALDGGVLEASTARAVSRLGHRGPDANGIRVFGSCTLGHTRLRIIDLSPLGDQPLANEGDDVWAVFNGEIYNFAELRSGLLSAGHRFRSETDTEVLVHLYEEYGDDMVVHLRGMFAFGIWDERRRRLLLARDRLGIKPLYFKANGGALSFSSEVQALAKAEDGIDVTALRSLLRLGWVPGPRTIRPGVQELLPGHRLVWESGKIRSGPYWSPAMSADDEPPTMDEMSAVLRDAIRRHLVSDVPVGLFLSAGVDSVAVARLAREVVQTLHTYTVAFESTADESVEAATIAGSLDLDHTVVNVGHSEALGSVVPFISAMDQPTVDGLNSWMISRAVREAGLVVALSGLGGDELFCGYSTFGHVPRLVRAGRAVRRLRPWPATAAHAFHRSRRGMHSRAGRALEGIAAGGWEASYAAVRGLFGEAELDALWPAGRDFKEQVIAPPPLEGDARAVVASLEMANYLPFQLLRDTDCMSMAHALEVRVPLLDDAVVTVALRGQRTMGDGWTKHWLMGAIDPQLSYLVHRPKRTFTLPIANWMRGGLRGTVEDAIANLGDAGLGFDRRALTDVWHGFLGGRVGWRSVWALTVLGMWLDAHAVAPLTTVYT